MPNAYHSLSGIYEFALDVAFDNARLFFGLVLTDDCTVERLLRCFCSGRLPELQLDYRVNDFAGVHRHLGKPQNFYCSVKQ